MDSFLILVFAIVLYMWRLIAIDRSVIEKNRNDKH